MKQRGIALAKYVVQLKDALTTGFENPAVNEALVQFREQNNLTQEDHFLAISKAGWQLDEFQSYVSGSAQSISTGYGF